MAGRLSAESSAMLSSSHESIMLGLLEGEEQGRKAASTGKDSPRRKRDLKAGVGQRKHRENTFPLSVLCLPYIEHFQIFPMI